MTCEIRRSPDGQIGMIIRIPPGACLTDIATVATLVMRSKHSSLFPEWGVKTPTSVDSGRPSRRFGFGLSFWPVWRNGRRSGLPEEIGWSLEESGVRKGVGVHGAWK